MAARSTTRRAALAAVTAALAGAAVLATTTASATDDPVAQAMRLYEKRHYTDAGRMLEATLPSLPPARHAAASLALGIVYLGNAQLHRELAQSALPIQIDYLRALASVPRPGGSRLAHLYLGQTLLEAGRPAEAIKPLERFLAGPGVGPRVKAVATADLGLAHYLRKDTATAQSLWDSIAAIDRGIMATPEVKATLASVWSRTGLKDRSPVAAADAVLKQVGERPSPFVRETLIAVYARVGQTARGLALLEHADLQAPSVTEVLGPTKRINFYDPALLGAMAALYRQASRLALERAATDPQLKGTAEYYLGAVALEAGDLDRALQATRAFLALPQVPPAYRLRARVREVAVQSLLAAARSSGRAEAGAAWEALAREAAQDGDALAEIVAVCVRHRVECAGIAPRAVRAAETGERRKTAALNFALGAYHLRKADLPQAVAYLESARDKTNKNRIEANDPVLLVNLAEAYYRTTQFSESLEIYFGMSRQFPVVRRLQEPLQGVYSMTHKSAGDVKIF